MRLAKGFFLLFLLLNCVTFAAVRQRPGTAGGFPKRVLKSKLQSEVMFAIICIIFLNFYGQKVI